MTFAAPKPIFDAETTKALERAVRLVDAAVPVLVRGETGTGKEVFTRAVHARSLRSGKPLVAVNCAALPETLMDAEFFGYRSGAFTGARPGGSKGYLREADGGVLFLDEIGDMPLSLQTKLLRALQEREIVPLGGGQPVPIDFMLICATNKDLWELVQAGSFRSDLYFRIAQYTIALPSLRSRADRAQLIDELWSSVGGRANGIALSPECRNELASYEWPGNFRQMVGCLRAMLALGEPGDVLTADALPPDVRRRGDDVDAKVSMSKSGTLSTLDAITITAMQEALAAAKGNVSRAARQLGVSRSTLYRRMQS